MTGGRKCGKGVKRLKKGIENGITHHEASMSRVGKQFEILLNYSNVEDTDFYNPFKYQLLDDSKEAIEIQKEAKKVIESIDTEISLITWKCGDCNEINDQTFDFCWKCGRDNFQ